MTSLILPPTTNHTYGQRGHRRFMYKEAKDWLELATFLLKSHKGENPTSVTITYYLKRERDVDGSQKIVLDALTHAGVVEDDKYIMELHLYKKFDKQNPRLEITWK